MQRDLSGDDVIEMLGLSPHPEGGHFRETFRDAAEPGKRAASTAIYFLLKEGERSHWHAVDAAEGWHFYAGDPLELDVSPTGGPITHIRLGADLVNGERPQAIVPAGHWQRARSLGKWTLVGCTVAPGFTFEGFTLTAPDFSPDAPPSVD
ncbi:cupin domain-containing protein [Hyphomicrobium sp.]|uniref:cupin domain-containing protein n=1 Tax=Hyphomicrobium sp. TaxID=82 RepID=UPI002D7693C6|nr:cupin domain-containing protein [Hyphomicrobium sp.]HET6389645.1 cupin domain-containing protein [Hyphomicrobium sp.]